MAHLKDLLFQPTFENPKGGGLRSPHQRDDTAAIKTYRFLRLGMVMIVVALLVSVFKQWRTTGCAQGSISAYYYTPARPIFVSGMVAIGVSLLVIKGSTVVEDMLLSAAGMLAPIVAFVPTTYEPPCVPHQRLGEGAKTLPNDIIANVKNNITALLVAGFVALGVAIFIFVKEQRDGRMASYYAGARIALLALTFLALCGGWWLLASENILDEHGNSAAVMFAALAVASLWNGISLIRTSRAGPQTSRHWKALGGSYVAIGIAMALAWVIMDQIWPDPWDHRTLVVEMTEIGLFVAMWIVQSVERWGKILSASPRPVGQA